MKQADAQLQPGEWREIAGGVHWLCLPLARSGVSVNAWALRDGRGWSVVDTGMDLPAVRQCWERFAAADGPLAGAPITRLVATHLHADHIGLAGWFEHRFGADLWMTRGEYLSAVLNRCEEPSAAPEDRAFYRAAGWPDGEDPPARVGTTHVGPLPASYRRIRDGEIFTIDGKPWEVVVGSGHSPEHACLFSASQGLLVSGDQVLPAISSNVSVTPREPGANPLREWLDSLDMLSRRVPDDVLVLPAHGAPFRGLHARLQALRDKRRRAIDRLVEHLHGGPLRAIDAVPILFGRSEFANAFVRTLAVGEALAYLNFLAHQGEVKRERAAEGVRWYAARRPSSC